MLDGVPRAVRQAIAVAGLVGLGLLFVLVHTPTAGRGGPDASFLFRGGFTLVAACSALAIVGCLVPTGPLGRGLAWSPLRLAGRASYSIYLFHLPVFVWALNHVDDPTARTAVALGGTLVLGGACYLAVERPVLRRRGRA